MVIIIILILLIIILLAKIETRVINKNQEFNVFMKIGKIFVIHIDYEKLIKVFVTNANDDFSIKELFENFKKLYEAYPFIRHLTKYTNLEDIKIISKYDFDNPYLIAINYNIFALVSKFAHDSFRRVKDEEYLIKEESEIKIDFDATTSIRVINIVIVFLNNIFKIPKLIKILK